MGLVTVVRGRPVVLALALLVVVALTTALATAEARSSAGVEARSSAGVEAPPVAAVVDYQLGGPYPPAADVHVVDRDRTAAPASGRYSICYVNAFQTQPDENGWWRAHHDGLLLRRHGRLVQDPDWPGEYLLDTSTAANRRALLAIVGGWIDGCARRGFRAVEPDNLDSWTRHGVDGAITRADDVAFARALITRSHARGLAIAQKNAAELTSERLPFDFAVAEECQVYRECDVYTKRYGRHVVEIEYTDNPRSAWTAACRARHGRISLLLRDRDVVPRGHAGYVFRHC